MSNSERISDELTQTEEAIARAKGERQRILEVLRKGKEVMSPYENDVNKFVREKGLHIIKWRMDDPRWIISRPPEIDYRDDRGKIQWTIQFGYNEQKQMLGLVAAAYIDREYDVPDGRVHERRLSDSPEKHLIATWEKGASVNIKELLDKAYERATSYTEQDLTRVSASITGKDGWTRRPYNPQLPVS